MNKQTFLYVIYDFDNSRFKMAIQFKIENFILFKNVQRENIKYDIIYIIFTLIQSY